MRVLFTTWAWPSHYFPMVPLAWALRAAGHEVRMTSQPELLPAMLASGLPATAVGTDLDVAAIHRAAVEKVEAPTLRGTAPRRRKADRVSDHVTRAMAKGEVSRLRAFLTLREQEVRAQSVFRTIRAEREAARESNMSLYGEVAAAMVDDLLELARSWRPDLVVYDPLTYAGPVVAKLLDVPAVRSLFGPDVTYFTNAGEVLGLGRMLDRFGIDSLDLLGAATVDPCPPSLQFPDELVPTRRLRTRYIPYNGISEVPPRLPGRGDRPRVCLTWGTSMVRMLGEQAFLPHDLLFGAAKAVEERDADLVLAIARGQRDLLTDVPSNVQIVESVPLQSLLEGCDALVHQGGAGTMLTGLCHGLPQLVVTQMPDQAVNALNLVSTGAGLTLPAEGLSASTVLAAVHELLDDSSYRAAAGVVNDDIRAQPTPAEVVDSLVALV